jgi:hypothetical protein
VHILFNQKLAVKIEKDMITETNNDARQNFHKFIYDAMYTGMQTKRFRRRWPPPSSGQYIESFLLYCPNITQSELSRNICTYKSTFNGAPEEENLDPHCSRTSNLEHAAPHYSIPDSSVPSFS